MTIENFNEYIREIQASKEYEDLLWCIHNKADSLLSALMLLPLYRYANWNGNIFIVDLWSENLKKIIQSDKFQKQLLEFKQSRDERSSRFYTNEF